MQIHADPDPKHCFLQLGVLGKHNLFTLLLQEFGLVQELNVLCYTATYV
jgi:hypothetical protein